MKKSSVISKIIQTPKKIILEIIENCDENLLEY